MAGSLQIAVKPIPNSTATVKNASAAGGGVGGIDSAAITSAITADTAHESTDDGTRTRRRIIASKCNNRAKRGSLRPH
eukprot:scaffold196871_cov36-Cyclotella_meneghiniana.AAC.2